MIDQTASSRFVIGGVRFFAASFLVGLLLLIIAPLDVIRAFCALALFCSAAGLALHIAALRRIDPGALPAFASRLHDAALAVLAFGGRALLALKARHPAG